MCKCDPKSTLSDQKVAKKFDNDWIVEIASIQVMNTRRGLGQTAAQRAYNQMVRREIRRRGLNWEPPS